MQQVLLRTTNLKFKGEKKGRLTKKFLPKWVGPFRVLERIGPLAYRLDLPPSMPVHNVFHTVLLKPFHESVASKLHRYRCQLKALTTTKWKTV